MEMHLNRSITLSRHTSITYIPTYYSHTYIHTYIHTCILTSLFLFLFLFLNHKRISEKKTSLEERVQKLPHVRQNTLSRVEEEVAQRVRQARRQWDTEERAVLEKALSQKSDAIKKQVLLR